MAEITQKLKWLHQQIEKDSRETQHQKKEVINTIQTLDKDVLDQTQRKMPQFSEEYLEDKYKERSPLIEGYLSHFLQVSEYVDNFPFETGGALIEISVPQQTFIKILKEIEVVNDEVSGESLKTLDEYEVKIGNSSFKFKQS
jgi:hypothetical protein